jgi:hypothetical protein
MRVDAVESLTNAETEQLTVYDDTSVERALHSFFAALANQDSLFAAEAIGRVPGGSGSSAGGVCSGDFWLAFRDAEMARKRSVHLLLVEKLIELLKEAGSADSLAVSLSLPSAASAKPGEPALRLRLEARGSSFEQAGLRWGLGLAHVQQALLFTSRYLRQQIGRDAE